MEVNKEEVEACKLAEWFWMFSKTHRGRIKSADCGAALLKSLALVLSRFVYRQSKF
jgi:hypothetical protein